MGKHHGWRVTEEPSGRHRGWAWDPVAEKYKTRTWDTHAQATAWASGKSVEMLTGSAPMGMPAAAPSLRTETAAGIYIKRLDAKMRSASHCANVAGTLRRMAKAVPDLAAPDAHRAMSAWVDALRIERVGRHKRKTKVPPSAGYRNRVIAELRAFCRWLVKQEHLSQDPSRLLETASVEHVIKAQFSVDEVIALCAMPSPDPVRQRRVALMLLAGLRADEAAAITWGDILGGQIYVRKHDGHRLKRKRERLVPLQPALAAILGHPGHAKEPIAPLRGVNSTVQQGRHFRLYLEACGIEPGDRTPHSCRHTYGAMLIATGVPSILAQQWMGHASMATTSDYAQAAPRHVASVQGWGMGKLRVGYMPDGVALGCPGLNNGEAGAA